jgi:GH25 family lysozyme M1 (1,4-beta-N-acetylmuramidase)
VQGIDVADDNHPSGAAIDWKEVARARYRFAFIKVSEGSYYVNRYYARDSAGAQAAGMFVAPYAFAIPNFSTGTLQADYAINASGYAPDGNVLAPILDIEYDPYAGLDGTPAGSWCYGLRPARMVSWIGAFITEAGRRTGQLPIIYTTAQWWDRCTGDTRRFGADPLWISGNNAANTAPAMPAAWRRWAFWQYTYLATVPGISVPTDASYLSSSALQLAAPARQSDQASTAVRLRVRLLDGGGAVRYTASGLPPGLSIGSASGVIGGTLPAEPAAFPISVSAAARGKPTASQGFTWDAHGSVALSPPAALTGSVGSPVLHQVAAADSLPGCTLTFLASGLPPGVSMTGCGLITGWPQRIGRYGVLVRVTDSSGRELAGGSFGWTVNPATGRGPTGHIRLAVGRRCLARLSGTSVAVEPCRATSAQRWTIAADGSLRVAGQCLAARNGRGPAPVALRVSRCGSRSQRWQVGSDAVLRNLSDGRCLLASGTASGSRAAAAPCRVTSNASGSVSTPMPRQQWDLPSGPLASGLPGLCASDGHPANSGLGSVTLQPCNGSAAQDWAVEPDGSVRSRGECLGLARGGTATGSGVGLYRCSRAPAQVWQLSGGPIGVKLLSPASGLCLGEAGDATAAGTPLVAEPCAAGEPGISWRAG